MFSKYVFRLRHLFFGALVALATYAIIDRATTGSWVSPSAIASNASSAGYVGTIDLKKVKVSSAWSTQPAKYRFDKVAAHFGSLPGGDELSTGDIRFRDEGQSWTLFVTANETEWFANLSKAKPRKLKSGATAPFRVTWAKLPADFVDLNPGTITFDGNSRVRGMP